MKIDITKIISFLQIIILEAAAQKCLKSRFFRKDINFDELGKHDKWWEVLNNLDVKQNETNCLTLRNMRTTSFGGAATTQYVNGNFDITEMTDKFIKKEPGKYTKFRPKEQQYQAFHKLIGGQDGIVVKRSKALFENYEVSWYTDYKDIIILSACSESGHSFWSVFTSTPTPSKRYNVKINRIIKRFGGNRFLLKPTVCQEIE